MHILLITFHERLKKMIRKTFLQKVKKVLTALLTTVSTRFIVIYGPFGNILLGAYQNHDQFFRSSG